LLLFCSDELAEILHESLKKQALQRQEELDEATDDMDEWREALEQERIADERMINYRRGLQMREAGLMGYLMHNYFHLEQFQFINIQIQIVSFWPQHQRKDQLQSQPLI